VRAPTPDIEGAFQAASMGRAMALIVIADFLTNSHRKPIVVLAVKNGLPGNVYRAGIRACSVV